MGNNFIDIQGYIPSDIENVTTYTLIQTEDGIFGDFDVTINGVPLSSIVNLDVYMTAAAELDSTGNDLLLTTPVLVWNIALPASAHGTFNITGSNTFTLGANLDDKSGAALGFGWDGTTLDKKGSGTLILNGANIYTGLTNIQGGILTVGSTAALGATTAIAGDVNVQSAATLGGHGTIGGTVHAFSGATVSPGNSIGTLTVGNIIFDAGEVDPFV